MFTYKKIKASDMNLRVLNQIGFTSPMRDIELINVPGRDGELIMDNGRYHSVVRSIPCRIEARRDNIEQLMNRIHNWLGTDHKYHDFLWHNDLDFVYKAKIEGQIESQRVLSRLSLIDINLRIHPIKYLRSSLREREIKNGSVIVNTQALEAKPMIRIVGSGNITLQIGDQRVILENLPEGCIIDSETQTITNLAQTTTLFSHMRSYPFPKLISGNNKLTWNANHMQVFIAPRLGALV